ncbi:alpha/beta hydrolase [Phytohabitans sp. ZYX-F-186]|uniref:Alpha/beta hydrolase n=1 Tax=Phytohabitans maris TaxID=3071409 RepID=A0ABU0ZQL4_9ACTN|nr:alpha/beta hydrolase [Phytohabitans sp. ZYX-F-186]MDQ7909312.1 alpha/beta hydrolase [Phytohabitans sp. ZYX-F-186]
MTERADLTFAEVLGFRPLRLDLYVPAGDGPWPLVVWVHGGAWRTGDRRTLPETIAPLDFFGRVRRRGYAVASVDYRLSGEARFPAPLHDVKAAVRWLRAHATDLGLDPDRFALWGESAGGHLAALAALTADATLSGDVGLTAGSSAVRAVVDWYGVADLTAMGAGHPDSPVAQLLGGLLPEVRALATLASPTEYADADAPPFLCVHGTEDQVVPYAQSEHLAAVLHAYGARCDLHPVPGAGHVFHGAKDVAALIETSLDFLDEVLKPAR